MFYLITNLFIYHRKHPARFTFSIVKTYSMTAYCLPAWQCSGMVQYSTIPGILLSTCVLYYV